jgi:lipid II:glycine glycyltransferase (peptidoglycan interpeptide bridge formation enzyme)
MDGKFYMLNWQLWEGTPEEWDQSLLFSEDYTVFQSFAWGEHKKNSGMIPVRYFCRDKNSEIQGMAQILVKRLLLGLVFIWVPGGLVFHFPNFKVGKVSEIIQGLIDKVRADYPRSLIRFHSHVETSPDLAYTVNKTCLRPFVKLNTGFSVQFNLDQSVAQMRQNMTSKHRYYTKKAIGSSLTWSVGNSDQQLATLAKIHQEMVNKKKLPSIGINLNELQSMRYILGDKVQILIGFLNEVPVTSCLVLSFGRKAFYMVAATGKCGREISAAYAMFERLMQELISRGITDFDFGGIDPVSEEAIGVNHFKCGFGGKLVEHLGEWELASSEKVRLVINLAIKLKGGRV